jgi:thymidine kinase
MKKILLTILCTILIQPSLIFSSQHPRGDIHIITGSMCSGKSEETIRLLHKLLRAKKDVLVVKPGIDNRKLHLQDDVDPTKVLSSRAGTSTQCIPVTNVEMLEEIIEQKNPSHIAIDEVHFFTPEKEQFITLILALAQNGKKIILSGLDLNFRGEPFGPMPELLAHADSVTKLTANCAVCHDDTYCITQRLIDGKPARYNDPLIVVGDSQYEPRCRNCHECPKE